MTGWLKGTSVVSVTGLEIEIAGAAGFEIEIEIPAGTASTAATGEVA
jgi:hypothetical protein